MRIKDYVDVLGDLRGTSHLLILIAVLVCRLLSALLVFLLIFRWVLG